MSYLSNCYFQDFKKTKNLSFLELMLIDHEEKLKPFKLDSAFILECLRINGRSIELLHPYDPSMLIDPKRLDIAYQSVGPVLMRSLAVSYRKTVRNLLQKHIRTTLKRKGTMRPKK
jgi:hypothetical protein